MQRKIDSNLLHSNGFMATTEIMPSFFLFSQLLGLKRDSGIKRAILMLLTVFLFVYNANPICAQQRDVDFVWVNATGAASDDMGKGIALDGLGYVYHTGGYSGYCHVRRRTKCSYP